MPTEPNRSSKVEDTIELKCHCYLIGYRGSGKSAVAAALAKMIGCQWLDTDDMVVKTAQRTIREIFALHGEEKFRELESAAIESTIALPPHVISLGGGAILRKTNCDTIRQHGIVCWLAASPEALWQRISSDVNSVENRPALTDLPALTELKTLLEKRTPLYESSADITIDTTGTSVEAVAMHLCTRLRTAQMNR